MLSQQSVAQNSLEPRLAVVRHIEFKPVQQKFFREPINPITTALILGAFAGLLATLWFVPQTTVKQHWIAVKARPLLTQTVVPVSYGTALEERVSRPVRESTAPSVVQAVLARNRRLEALVQVLQKRNAGERSGTGGRHLN